MPSVPHFALAAAVGILCAWLYAAVPATRTFVTYLGPSVLVFPALFLLHPSMRSFMAPDDGAEKTAATIPPGGPPVVMVVFDQLPLTSLLSESGGIDPRYPNFAALADDATWFRNATTVAELTGWAMPALTSGSSPQRSRLPTAHDYPANLFTALGRAYRHEVIEPITHLCPERLCGGESAPVTERLRDPDARCVHRLPAHHPAVGPSCAAAAADAGLEELRPGRALADALDQRARRGSA